MGPYEANPRNGLAYSGEGRSQWNPNSSMEGGIGNLVDRFSGLGVSESSEDASLFQVIMAVEAAETTIKHQVEENNRLRTELQKRTAELARFQKSDDSNARLHVADLRDDHISASYKSHQSVSSVGNQEDRVRWTDSTSMHDPQGILVLHQNLAKTIGDSTLHTQAVGPHYTESKNVNGTLKQFSGGQAAVEDASVAQFSLPFSRSHSPSRYQREGAYEPKNNLSGHGSKSISEIDNQSNIWKQDLILKVRDHEDEILLLRKHLAEYSVKEAQIRNEKYVLEKRIAYMRMAFDQQQQDLVDAASKSLSYRQDIIEENIRLTYALQAAQQERSTFVSSLLPLLDEYFLQPPVLDAQSIISNLKVLFKHLQERLLVTEEKLKESQYQLAPWRSDLLNYPSSSSQFPSPLIGAALTTSMELVPQPVYSQAQIPISIPSNAQTTTDRNLPGQHNNHADLVGLSSKYIEPDNLGRSSPSSRHPAGQDVPYQFVARGDSHGNHFSEESSNKQLSFNDMLSSSEMGDPDSAGNQKWKEPSNPWGSGNSPYLTPTQDDQNSLFSPYLTPVLEEPTSSFSEAGEDDPMPAIDGLQIAGEAYPGRELQACGYSINGTTSCNFEWVRHLEDGSVKYIDGAKQPNYLVTADDVDSYLAIEVQPLDNRKRKGELVKVFANEQRKITCDQEMQEQIEKTLHSGHPSYEVSLAAGYLDIWESAILAIKREGYSIKCVGPRGIVVTEKFLPTTAIAIPYGHPTAFSILGTGEHLLKTSESSSLRDTIVLTMRLFIIRAMEKRKRKKKGLFFTK